MENNFKRYEQHLIDERKVDLDQVHHNLTQSRSAIGFVGELIELYVPKVFELMTRMGGGPTNKRKYPHED